MDIGIIIEGSYPLNEAQLAYMSGRIQERLERGVVHWTLNPVMLSAEITVTVTAIMGHGSYCEVTLAEGDFKDYIGVFADAVLAIDRFITTFHDLDGIMKSLG